MATRLADPWTEAVDDNAPPAEWARIADADVPLVVEPRALSGALAEAAAALTDTAPFTLYGEGPLNEAVAQLGDLPLVLREDILTIGARYRALMQVEQLRIRLEGITSNACWKIHADYTDVRLISTYEGPTSQYIPVGAPAEEAHLRDVPLGAIALFKGRNFAEDHAPCFHRSPPAADLNARRLMLVIDTPLPE